MSDVATDVGTIANAGSVDSQIDSAFEQMDGANATTGAEPGFGAPGLTDPAEQLGPPDGRPPAEGPVEGEKPAEPETTEQPKEETAPGDEEVGEPRITVSAKGIKEYHYPEDRAKVLIADRQAMQAIREKIPDFTPEAATQHYQAFADREWMKADLISGDPQRLNRVVDHLAHTAIDGGNPRAFGDMVIHATNVLARGVPQAYRAMIAEPAIDSTFDHLYQQAFENLRQAEASRNPDQIKNAQGDVFRLQRTNWELTQRYKNYEDAKNIDPYAAQRAELDQREQTVRSWEQQRQANETTQWNQHANSQREAAVASIVDELLADIKGRFKDKGLINLIRDGVLQGAEKKVSQNSEWKTLFDIAMEKALRTRSQADLEAAVKTYATRARPIIASEVKRLIPPLTESVLEGNRSRHAALAAGSSRKEPSGGAAVRRSIMSSPANAGSAKGWESEMDQLLGSLGG